MHASLVVRPRPVRVLGVGCAWLHEQRVDQASHHVSVKKMRNHLTFAEEGEWNYDNGDSPAILAICHTKHDQKKLNRQMKKALSDSSDADDTPCGTTTLEQLMNASKATDKIWTSITWVDDARQSTLLGITRKS